MQISYTVAALNAEQHYKLGITLLRQGDPAGETNLAAAVRLDPNYFDAIAMLGRYLFQCGACERALPYLQKASALRPDNPEVRLELADSYLSTRRLDDAAVEFERVRREHPNRPVALAGLAAVHAAHGRYEQAHVLFEQALARHPDNPWIGLHYSRFLLRSGDFTRGWPLYEVRRRAFLNRDVFNRPLSQPIWDGQSLAGRRLLITAEQGLGDEIMFASTYAEVIREAAHCTIECDRRLVPLMQRSFPTTTVYGADRRSRTWNTSLERDLKSLPTFDCWVPAGTIPLYRRMTAESFPAHSGYLKADDARVAHWRERLAALGPGLKVGISWRGGTAQTNAGTRSLTLQQLMPLLSTESVHFVSVQYGDCAKEIDAFAAATGIKVHHWQEAVDDYDETAALVCALDVVISVCTAVVHLTGALGKPAWVMAPFVPEWRYGYAGTSMIWYPSVRMFRQPAMDDWTPVIGEVARTLRDFAAR
jgi:tetratricopeptide (TPR) repeat protein